jgi:trigger factor
MSGPRALTKRKKIDAMQVTETLVEGLKHEFKISVPASDLDAKAGAKLIDLKDKVKLNGFRPGKVPVSHLKKVYGRSVMAETIDQTIRDTNTQIFTDRGFRLATEPKITMPTEEKEVEELLAGKSDLTYTVAIEVVPTIQLADFKSFTVEKPVVDVSDSDVDDAIKRIADQSRPYNAKSEGAKAENGDRVTINFTGRIDGTPVRGWYRRGHPGRDRHRPVHSGLRRAVDRHRRGRDPHAEGRVPEELRERKARRPARRVRNHRNADRAPGETAIDDEFAKTLGLESLDKLKEAARERLAPNSPVRPASASSARCSTASTRATSSRRRRR